MANEQDRQPASDRGSSPVPLGKGASGEGPDTRSGPGQPPLETPAGTPIAEQPTIAGEPLAPRRQVPPVPKAPMPPPGAGYPQSPPPHAAYPHQQQPHVPGPGQQPYAPGPSYPQGQPYGPAGYPQAAAYPQAQGYGYPPGAPWHRPPVTGICSAAMVVGIIAAVLAVTLYGMFLTVIMGPIALCLGVSARRKVARGEAFGSSQATTGFVLGIITTVISWALLALVVIGFLAE